MQINGNTVPTAEIIAKLQNIQKTAKRKPQPAPTLTDILVQLPLWDERVRGLPNPLARSALFVAANRKEPRHHYKRHPIASIQGVEIFYTGEELRQDDEDVFLQVVHMARTMPLGEMVEFSGYSLLKALGWSATKGNYQRLRESIDRLSANTVVVQFDRGEKGYGGSLFRKFAWDADAKTGSSQRWKIWLEKEIVQLFGSAGYTQIDWAQRLQLPPLAKWLHQFYFTHRQPFGYKVESLHRLCGSRVKAMAKFRFLLKEAMQLLVEIGFLESWSLDTRTDVLLVQRVERKKMVSAA